VSDGSATTFPARGAQPKADAAMRAPQSACQWVKHDGIIQMVREATTNSRASESTVTEDAVITAFSTSTRGSTDGEFQWHQLRAIGVELEAEVDARLPSGDCRGGRPVPVPARVLARNAFDHEAVSSARAGGRAENRGESELRERCEAPTSTDREEQHERWEQLQRETKADAREWTQADRHKRSRCSQRGRHGQPTRESSAAPRSTVTSGADGFPEELIAAVKGTHPGRHDQQRLRGAQRRVRSAEQQREQGFLLTNAMAQAEEPQDQGKSPSAGTTGLRETVVDMDGEKEETCTHYKSVVHIGSKSAGLAIRERARWDSGARSISVISHDVAERLRVCGVRQVVARDSDAKRAVGFSGETVTLESYVVVDLCSKASDNEGVLDHTICVDGLRLWVLPRGRAARDTMIVSAPVCEKANVFRHLAPSHGHRAVEQAATIMRVEVSSESDRRALERDAARAAQLRTKPTLASWSMADVEEEVRYEEESEREREVQERQLVGVRETEVDVDEAIASLAACGVREDIDEGTGDGDDESSGESGETGSAPSASHAASEGASGRPAPTGPDL
jgi:hypothetical protein